MKLNWKKNCKITTYLYQIILIDHKKHLGAMEKTYILGSTAETKPCGVGLQVNFDDHLVSEPLF